MDQNNQQTKNDGVNDEFECLDAACFFKVKKNGSKTPEEKVSDLKNAIRDLGYTVEDTDDGIKISE